MKDFCDLGEKDVGKFEDTENFLGITNLDIVNKNANLKISDLIQLSGINL